MRLQNLGYAVTVHCAQGVTVDTTHTVLTGTESRQQLYVAMSRGRESNEAYVQVVDGGEENAPIHPATVPDQVFFGLTRGQNFGPPRMRPAK